MRGPSAAGGPELSLLRAFPRHDAAVPVTILHAAGNGADLVRLTPVVEALRARNGVRQAVIHAPPASAPPEPLVARPTRWLSVDAPTQGERTALMLHRFEQVLVEEPPELVVVYGASDAALACGLAAVKQGIPIAHLEAGLRAPGAEARCNINRVLTDRLADTLLTPTHDAVINLLEEGIPDTRISAVGSTAIDVLRRNERDARERAAWSHFGGRERRYVLVVLRGQGRETGAAVHEAAREALCALAARHPVILSMPAGLRPWTDDDAELAALRAAGIAVATPQGYLDHLSLESGAGAVVTDVGAVQDDTSALGVRCYTLADGTDRATTLKRGTNILLGADPAAMAEVRLAGARLERRSRAIPLWDGFAGERAAERLVAHHVLVRSDLAG